MRAVARAFAEPQAAFERTQSRDFCPSRIVIDEPSAPHAISTPVEIGKAGLYPLFCERGPRKGVCVRWIAFGDFVSGRF